MKKMDLETVGKILLLVGLGVAVLGGGLWVLARLGLPLGKLPGDINIQGSGVSFYFPIVSCLLLSIVATLVINVVLRIFRK